MYITSNDISVKRFHAELNMSFRYTSYIEHGDELNHPMLDVSEFLSEVDNPEDNIEYCKEGRKAHQEELVNSARRRKRLRVFTDVGHLQKSSASC